MSAALPLPDGWQHWPAEAKARLLDVYEAAEDPSLRSPFYCDNPDCDGEPHGVWVKRHARAKQRPPAGDWSVWLILAGRGFGKTVTGAEWAWRMAQKYPRGIFVAPTYGDVRDTMIEGETGILARTPRIYRPNYEPSKRLLTYPNGATVNLRAGEEPERIRGPQAHYGWGDEWAMWRHIKDATDNLLLMLRLGTQPRLLLTTTPKPRKVLREQLADPETVVVRGSTYENVQNLAPPFKRMILRKFEGTSVGAQELHAEILEDIQGALWNGDLLGRVRVHAVPIILARDLTRLVIAIDPAVTAEEGSNETGIVAVGISKPNHCPHCGPIADGPHGFALEDLSGIHTPNTWASLAIAAYHRLGADAIVAEVNNGGDLVRNTIHTIDRNIRYRAVRASRGKQTRAEPVAALYEQGRFHNLVGLLLMEEQMRSWVPGAEVEDSPDRVDALVWGATDLMLGGSGPVGIAAG